MSKHPIIQELERERIKKEIAPFHVGDTVEVHTKIVEGDKERTQVFKGTVIAKKGKGLSETFNLHRIAFGVGMEKVFHLHSPRIQKIDVVRRGKVRRAKLYYIRGKQGKAAKIKGLEGGRKKR